MSSGTSTRALQSALAGQHAAIYGYGVVGAHLTGAARDRAVADFDSHRAWRDELAVLIRSRGEQPVAAASSYTLPADVTSSDDAIVLATLLEERLAALWADGVVALSGGLRALAVGGLRDAAVRAAAWRGGSVPFPGLPERAS